MARNSDLHSDLDDGGSHKKDTHLLLVAVRKNDLSAANHLIVRGAVDLDEDLNRSEFTTDRNTFLLEAIRRCHFDMVRLLIDSGADLITTYNDDHSPLHEAIKIKNRNSRWEMVKLLKAAGVSVVQNQRHATKCIHLAVESNDFEMVKMFMDDGAEINCVDCETDFGPLHVAVSLEEDRLEMIQNLVEAGADVNLNWQNGYTPRLGDDVERRNGYTCLHYASESMNCSKELIQVLLSAGAQVNTLYGESLLSPLAQAVQNDDFDLVEDLIEVGADINLSQRCSNSPLELAILMHNEQIVRLLLKHGADCNACDDNGRNVLYCAAVNYRDEAESQYIQILKLLIGHGAQLFCRRPQFEPFDAVARFGTVEAINLFSEKGFDLKNCRERLFPLHQAAKNSKEEVMKFLLESGLFDVNRVHDLSGCTPLFLAIHSRNFACARVLVEWDANVTIHNASSVAELEDFDSRTPLEEAFRTGEVIYIDLLMSSDSSLALSTKPDDIESVIKIAMDLKDVQITKRLFGLIIRSVSQGFSVEESVCRFMKDKFSESSIIVNQCLLEIQMLKGLRPYHNLSLYDILTRRDITAFVNNEEVAHDIYCEVSDRHLRIFVDQMRFRYSIACTRRKSMDDAKEGLSKVLDFRLLYCSEVHCQIMKHLSITDLCRLSHL